MSTVDLHADMQIIGAEGRNFTVFLTVLNQRQPGLQRHPHQASGALLNLFKDRSG